jgi:hypothetical protein
MNRFAQSSTFPWRLLLLLVVVCMAVGLFVNVRTPRPARFIVLHQPFHMPVPLRDRLTRWIPRSANWAWAWRVEETVFGQRKPVNVYAEVVSLTGSSGSALSSLSLGPASFSHANGLQVWLLGADQLKALREHHKQTPGTEPPLRPRISTADGIECQLFQGQRIALNGSTNEVGCTFRCCPRVHPDCTDLMACITLSELVTNQALAPGGSAPVILIQTNLDTALRLRIPRGSGFFLFDRSASDSSRKPIGVIVDPLQPKT